MSRWLSADGDENVSADLGGDAVLVGDDSHHAVVRLLVEFCSGILNRFGAANTLALLGCSEAVGVDISVLNVDLERVDPVLIVVLDAGPFVVVGERDGPEAAYLHNLLDGSAILFFLVVGELLCAHGF